MALADLIDIEVVYAGIHEQASVTLKVAATSCVKEAIIQSGLLIRFPEINLTNIAVGIYSKPVQLETVLQAHDRIEIYRNLVIEPKQARRNRASGRREYHR